MCMWWERKTAQPRQRRPAKAEPLPRGIGKHALQARVEITRTLSTSADPADRQLAQSINQYQIGRASCRERVCMLV